MRLTAHFAACSYGRRELTPPLPATGCAPLARASVPYATAARRVGATAPPPRSRRVLAAIAILIWYPVTFTGEWVELLSAWLFLATSPLSTATAGLVAAAAIPISLAMTWVSAMRRPADDAEFACARTEVAALLRDLVGGLAGTPDLDQMHSVHKRVWSSAESGLIDVRLLRGFRDAPCAGVSSPSAVATRRRYFVDPWGTAYWIEVNRHPESGARRFVVYSFGPNRRRDGDPGRTTGDDVSAQEVRR